MRVKPVVLRRALIVLLHVALIPLGYLAAFALRWEFAIPDDQLSLLLATAPILLALRLAAFGIFGQFTGWLRHFGVEDLLMLLKALVLSELAFAAVLFGTGLGTGFPRTALVLDLMISLLVFGGGHFAVRLFREGRLTGSAHATGGKRTLILGAGNAAARLIHDIRTGALSDLLPVGLVDDDPAKRSLHIHGVSVVGNIERLPELVSRYQAQLVVIAMPSATRAQMQRVVERCMESRVEFKVVPSLQELLDGGARLNTLRKLELEDLLGRPSVQLQLEDIKRDIVGRTILITGGAGSIGMELARQVGSYSPSRLIVLEQAESSLYFAHIELCKAYPALEIIPVIADIRNPARLARVFASYRPDYVFHAAAYKHVPLMEDHLEEAVRNNVFGTLNVAQLAAVYGSAKFVLISTDKAVQPSSIMGATKRVAERVVLESPVLRDSGTDYRVVRFGNVLGSDGSVVPLFHRQLAAGGPLTVTHPEVTRYFMTIREASQLVLQAASLHDAAGRISMLEMGEPVRILDLAEKLVQLAGLKPYRDIPIVFTGLRPGEKLHEELVSELEETVPTSVSRVHIVQTREADQLEFQRCLEELRTELITGNHERILQGLRALVPEAVTTLGSRAAGATSVPFARVQRTDARLDHPMYAGKLAAHSTGERL